jgi:hypothetical protein
MILKKCEPFISALTGLQRILRKAWSFFEQKKLQNQKTLEVFKIGGT